MPKRKYKWQIDIWKNIQYHRNANETPKLKLQNKHHWKSMRLSWTWVLLLRTHRKKENTWRLIREAQMQNGVIQQSHVPVKSGWLSWLWRSPWRSKRTQPHTWLIQVITPWWCPGTLSHPNFGPNQADWAQN